MGFRSPPVLSVSRVYAAEQVDGMHAGTLTAVIRLYGCGVRCPWCDVPFTWDPAPKRATFAEVTDPAAMGALMAEATPDVLADWVATHGLRQVLITGGEPFEQNLLRLYPALIDRGCYIQVETSGTVAVPDRDLIDTDWITVSPKRGLSGKRPVVARMVDFADEIKMPVAGPRDVHALRALLRTRQGPDVPVWLQPIDQAPEAARLCQDAAARYGWHVSGRDPQASRMI